MLHYANLSLILYSIVKLFDVSHDFLPLTNAELSTLKQVRFFWPTLYRWVSGKKMEQKIRYSILG